MPLLDHFQPPLSILRPWEGVHSAWAAAIANLLNTQLPPHYVALPLVQLGGRVEIDVAAAKENGTHGDAAPANGGVATHAPPRPALQLPVDFSPPDIFEVRVFHEEGGLHLRAAIELVSPGNKDRPSHRRALAVKCSSYLASGAAVVVVDVVTERRANLHAEILDVLQHAAAPWQATTGLSAIAYRSAATLEIWPESLALGATLPTLPLWLEPAMCLPLDLEASYAGMCAGLRISK